jgi:hypothetical protein
VNALRPDPVARRASALPRRALLGAALPALAGCANDKASGRRRPGRPAVVRPVTLPRTRSFSVKGDLTKIRRSPFPITSVALAWRGPANDLRIRFYDESGSASPWKPVRAGCPCGADSVAGSGIRRALVLAADAQAFRLSRPAGADLLGAVVMDTVHDAATAPARPSRRPRAPAHHGNWPASTW